jgi:hypothetical protein
VKGCDRGVEIICRCSLLSTKPGNGNVNYLGVFRPKCSVVYKKKRHYNVKIFCYVQKHTSLRGFL